MVIYYIDHALDHFMKSFYFVENNIVRQGGISTNEIMLELILKEIKRGANHNSMPLCSRHGKLIHTKIHLEEWIKI